MNKLRYEIKFLCSTINYDSLINWIKNSPDLLTIKYPSRRINNIYFDNDQNECLFDNFSGVSQREKIRYRWYGLDSFPTIGQLEIKHKRNNLGYKTSYNIKNNIYNQSSTWPEIISSLKKQIPFEARFFLDKYYKPNLVNRYFREYYEGFNGNLRLTIDSMQDFFYQQHILKPNFLTRAKLKHFLIIELKFDKNNKQYASNFLENFPFRRSRYSKYVDGMLHSV